MDQIIARYDQQMMSVRITEPLAGAAPFCSAFHLHTNARGSTVIAPKNAVRAMSTGVVTEQFDMGRGMMWRKRRNLHARFANSIQICLLDAAVKRTRHDRKPQCFIKGDTAGGIGNNHGRMIDARE